MVQKLNHSELKDITDIVYYTNLKQKNLVYEIHWCWVIP